MHSVAKMESKSRLSGLHSVVFTQGRIGIVDLIGPGFLEEFGTPKNDQDRDIKEVMESEDSNASGQESDEQEGSEVKSAKIVSWFLACFFIP